MRKFLIINPFGIGDVLFTTPVIKAIKDNLADVIIGYWCNDRVKPILDDNPYIDKIFALSRGDIKKIYQHSRLKGISESIKLFLALKKEHFDTSLDFSLDHRYSLISKFLGIKQRLGFNYKNRGRFLTEKIDIQGYSDKHIVDYYLDLLKLINISPDSHNLNLFVSEKNKINANQILASLGIMNNKPLIGIVPGAGESWGKDAYLKHWPQDKFAQLLDRIIDNFDTQILILGDEAEQIIADRITSKMRNKAVNLTGKITLEEFIAIINNLDMLITNDGGPLHMAVALGKKTVSFFGPVDPKVYGPYPTDEKHHIVLRRVLDCIPCYHNFRLSPCLKNKQCLEKIDVEQALNAVSTLLSKKESI